MTGRKLLTVEPLRVEPAQRDRLVGTGRTFVCVDTVGAGQGELIPAEEITRRVRARRI